jgi:hypothetical protein
MHLVGLDGTHNAGKNKNFWTASARVFVVDVNDQPVAGAVVSGTWSNVGGSVVSCVTGTDGSCTVPPAANVKVGETVVFTVLDVTHPVLTYEPAANVVSAVTVATTVEELSAPPTEEPADLAIPAIFLPLLQQP